MKIVILFGSPRENGCTSRLVSAFCSSLPKDAQVQLIKAYKLDIKPCLSCGKCINEWTCRFDDMDAIINALLECDMLVIASPVYHLTFPAPLKAILDRTQRCFNAHRQGRSPFARKQREAVVLLTAGAPSERGDVIRQQLRWLLPPLNARLRSFVICPNTDAEGVSNESIRQAMEIMDE